MAENSVGSNFVELEVMQNRCGESFWNAFRWRVTAGNLLEVNFVEFKIM